MTVLGLRTDSRAALDHPSGARSFLRLARPGQWVKNLLVVAAPAAAGVLERPAAIARTLILVVAFTAGSMAIYAVNDVLDARLDREHPRKRNRPVACGTISPVAALSFGAATALIGVALAALLGVAALGTLAAYLVVSGLYAVRLKHLPVFDVAAVASGFVLRALAGAAGNHLPVSNWFLLVSLFGALYLVTGKRNAEAAGRSGPEVLTRPVLATYPPGWLQQVMTMALTGTVISYAMWAFQYIGTDVVHPMLAVSVAPFLMMMLRFGLLLAQSGAAAEQPERILLTDRVLLGTGAVWVLLVGAGIYLY